MRSTAGAQFDSDVDADELAVDDGGQWPSEDGDAAAQSGGDGAIDSHDDDHGDEGAAADDAGDGDTGRAERRERNLVRRVAAKAEQVAFAPSSQTALLASLLGCADSVSSLTTAVISGVGRRLSPIADVTALRDSEPLQAGIAAAAMDRDRLKALWRVLQQLGAVGGGRLPASDPKAALAVAEAAVALSEEQIAELDAVASLGSRRRN